MKCSICGQRKGFYLLEADGIECVCADYDCITEALRRKSITSFTHKKCDSCGAYLNPGYMLIRPGTDETEELGFCDAECAMRYLADQAAGTHEDT